MRIHLITIITLITCMQVSGRASGQQVTLSLKDAPLETAFKAIERQTQYVFFFPSRVVKDKKPVTLELKQADFRTAMERILEGQGLTYLLSENSVIIKEAGQRGGMVEDIVVRGRVVDGNKKPLAGVTVKLKGSDVGAFTDNDGRFSLKVPNEDAVLLISSVGYISVQVRVGSKRLVDVSLVESTAQLKEVTVAPVSTGYEDIKPERFIGSATVVDSAILQRAAGSDLLSRLDGTANGLLFNKTSTGGISLQLRGVSTLSGNTLLNGQPAINPLIILDDFPYAGDINNINPNDIESITLLKDAVAASIWGARAGNGVIVITSKKTKRNKPLAITFNSNVQVQSKPDQTYFPVMSSSDFIDVEQFLFDKGFQDIYLRFPSFYPISPAVEIMDKKRRGLISAADAEKHIQTLKQLDVRDDYDKYVFRNGVNTQNYLGLSGAAGFLGYNVSLGADNSSTGIKGSGGSDRYTINSLFSLTPVKRIEITAGINYVVETQKGDGLSAKIVPPGRRALYPYAQFADKDGKHLAIPYQYAKSYIDTLGGGKLLDWHYVPLDELGFANDEIKLQMLRMNFGTRVKILSWLYADVKYQYSRESSQSRRVHDERTYFTRNMINSYTAPDTYQSSIPLGGILDQGYRELLTHNLRGQLNISKSWYAKHDVNGLLAAEMSTGTLNSNAYTLYGYDDEILASYPFMDYSSQFPLFFGGTARIPNNVTLLNKTDRFVSLLGNLSYTYDGRYNAYVSARRDGSNLLGVKTNNRWKPLWSVGGRWNVSAEPFFNLPGISNLSFRASIGYSGNVNNSVTALSTISYRGFVNDYGQVAAFINGPPNPDLRWEEVRTFNLGMDLSVLNNRLSGTFEFYRKKSNDVITNVPADPTIGVPEVTKNAANLKGSGFDIQVNSKNLTGKFSWNTTLNLSYAKTIVTEYFAEITATPLAPVVRKGEMLNGMYAYRWAGLDPETGDPRGYLGKEISKDYPAIFFDSASNQVYKGSSFPLLFGNIMNTLRYKGLEFSFNISFRGNYYFRRPSIRYDRLYTGWQGHADYEKRWQKPGDEAITNIPSMNYPMSANRDQFYEYSEVNLDKGDNIRLQDLRLSYSLTNERHPRNPVKNMQLYLYADNLNIFLWKATKSGYDPDYPVTQLPPLRSLAFGIKMHL